MCCELWLIAKSWNYDDDEDDFFFLPEKEPVISNGQIQDLGRLQAGVHRTILWKIQEPERVKHVEHPIFNKTPQANHPQDVMLLWTP